MKTGLKSATHGPTLSAGSVGLCAAGFSSEKLEQIWLDVTTDCKALENDAGWVTDC